MQIIIELVNKYIFEDFRNSREQGYRSVIFKKGIVSLFKEWNDFCNFETIRKNVSVYSLINCY